ncbi:MAG: anti-CBASS protein Acb1 family protein, partial [Acidiferrobacteraceae bacterium]
MYGANNFSQDSGPAFISANAGLSSSLVELLMAPDIVPGTMPGYQLCKTIFVSHPLGAVLTDAPIRRAQGLPRTITIPTLGEDRLVEQYERTWNELGRVGGTVLLHNLFSLSRVYGIASLAVGEVGKDTAEPLDMDGVADADLFFNILDPLNTAGSLVLNLDPNSPDFLKPRGAVSVSGKVWHPSRLFVKMNESPIYIEYTTSAFGFVGRSVYQRALYPLKSFVQSMITDQMVTQKAGLLVYKAESPGSLIDNVIKSAFGQKRGAIKSGVTGQVLSIGVTEAIETLNMQNVDKAAEFVRTNILKNIASAAGMPASIILQEAMVSGLADGTEDANKEIAYLDHLREEMDPAYAFLDAICRRKAWTPAFYETLRSDYSDFGEGGFESALHDWIRSYKASWPNLKIEPDSEKVKTEDVQMKAVIALAEVLLPDADPATKAKIFTWVAENVNGREHLFAGMLDIDEDEILTYFEENQQRSEEAQDKEPSEPKPFSEKV